MAEPFDTLAMLATWVEPQHLPFLKLQALEADHGENKAGETQGIRGEEIEVEASIAA